MATIYVDSAAGGANNGTSWADAYTSLASTLGAAAGDDVLVDDGHAENLATTTTWSWSNGTALNPVRIHSVDKATGAWSSGAAIVVTANVALTLAGGTYAFGLSVTLADQLTLSGVSAPNRQVWEGCNFQLATTGSNRRIVVNSGAVAGVHVVFRDCNIDLQTNGIANSTIMVQCYGTVEFLGGTIRVAAAAQQILIPSSRNPTVVLDGVDLGNSAEVNIANVTLANANVTFARCRLPAGWSYVGPAGMNARLTIEHCAAGTITSPTLGLVLSVAEAGTVEATTSSYRSGGADDGAQINAIAWKMVANASAREVYTPLSTPPLVAWVAGGASATFRFHVASGTTLNDDDFWVELSGPDGGSPASSRAHLESRRMSPLATPAPLTSDGTSSWIGSGVGTAQKVEVTYTPQVEGPVVARGFLARPNTTVYLDPLIEVA